MLKRFERWGKLLLAWVAAAALWRPGRCRWVPEKLRAPRRILLVRIDERLGEALLTTPLFRALRQRADRPEVHVLVHRNVARVLRAHPEIDALHTLDARDRVLGPLSPAIRRARRRGFDVVVNCASWDAPSVGPAIVCRLVAPHAALIGPRVAPIRWLQDLSVAALPDTRSEVRQRLHLLSPLGVETAAPTLSFRAAEPDEAVKRIISAIGGRSYAVVNPGGRLDARRVPPDVFSAAARALVEAGIASIVTWGPGEEELARRCAEGASAAFVAPRTSIDQLAALMRGARLTVCNNTGPMHLSVAVGTPTLAFFIGMEMARWGHAYPPHQMIDVTSVADPAAEASRAVLAFLTGSAKPPSNLGCGA